jgi:LEA14-like dessication related protein
MDRVDRVFATVVVVSVVLGAVSVAGFADSLATRERALSLSDEIAVTLTDAELDDGAFVLSVRIRNPTSVDVTATGVFVSVGDGNTRLAYGSATGFKSRTVPANTTRRIRVSVPLTPEQAARLRDALAQGQVVVTTRYGMVFEGVPFVVRPEPTRIDGGRS